MAALDFFKHYSRDEMLFLGGIVVVILGLLGLLSNSILQGRGFGIFGNAFLIGVGGGLALAVQSWLMSQPDLVMLGGSGGPALIGLIALMATTILLGAAVLKKHFA